MARRAWLRTSWLLGAAAAAIAACGGSSTTSPHQPGQCPSFSGGVIAPGDSLYGVYRLVSYCLDTLPAYGPPTDTGHVTLSHASADSFFAVIGTQGQPPESILGTYTHPVPDSIHVTGEIRGVPGVPFAVPIELRGRFLLQNDTLSVSGRLAATGTAERPLSLVGARVH